MFIGRPGITSAGQTQNPTHAPQEFDTRYLSIFLLSIGALHFHFSPFVLEPRELAQSRINSQKVRILGKSRSMRELC